MTPFLLVDHAQSCRPAMTAGSSAAPNVGSDSFGLSENIASLRNQREPRMRRHNFRAAADDDSLPVMVPSNDKAAVPISLGRVRRLRKHLVVTLRSLRTAKNSEHSVSPLRPEPEGFCCPRGAHRLFSVQGMVL